MKTTVELPDEPLRHAKQVAAAHDTSMRELMTEGLRAELERRTSGTRRADFVFRSVDGSGLRDDLDAADVVEVSYAG